MRQSVLLTVILSKVHRYIPASLCSSLYSSLLDEHFASSSACVIYIKRAPAPAT